MSTRISTGSPNTVPPEKDFIITGCTIHTPLECLEDHALTIRGRRIMAMGPSSECRGAVERHVFENCLAVPGFIDIHFHGALGIHFNESDSASIKRALAAHLKNGTTAVLPAVMTGPESGILKAIGALREAHESRETGVPEIAGINLEGPFISEEKRGVHKKDDIRPITADEMERYLKASKGMIRIVTVAPEREGALALIRFLASKGIIASAGHTNADYDTVKSAIESGIRLSTHLFNAMKGIMQREPGALGALLLDDRVYSEIIGDGEHVHPALLKLAARVKGPDRMILITDSSSDYGFRTMATRTKSGTLVGGNRPLPAALKIMVEHSGLTLGEALRTVTINPARLLGIENRIGVLQPGADADIVILNRDLSVRAVFCKGLPVSLQDS